MRLAPPLTELVIYQNVPIDKLNTETALVRADEATHHGEVIRLIDLPA